MNFAMSRSGFGWIAVPFIVAVASGAAAQTHEIQVRSGVPTAIGGLLAYAPGECIGRALSPTRVLRQPSRGTVAIVEVQTRLTEGPCAGATVNGLRFTYTSAAGYRGPDEVVIEVEWEPGAAAASRVARSQTYRIMVQ